MSFKAARLVLGDWLLLICSVALVVDLFGVDWFMRGVGHDTAVARAQVASKSGWEAFSVLGPLVVIVCAVGIAIWWLQGTRRSPAIPAILTTLLLPVAALTFVLLAIRVFADHPGGVRAGAYIGLVLSLGAAAGAYLSLRREGVATIDAPDLPEAITIGAGHLKSD